MCIRSFFKSFFVTCTDSSLNLFSPNKSESCSRLHNHAIYNDTFATRHAIPAFVYTSSSNGDLFHNLESEVGINITCMCIRGFQPGWKSCISRLLKIWIKESANRT